MGLVRLRIGEVAVMDTDKAVKAILADVTDRRGWRQAWDMFDDDIQEEIKVRWKEILDGLNV